MNKLCIFPAAAILVSACSMTVDQIFLIPTTPPSPTIASSARATDIPTFTATIPTPTFTTTPTLAGLKTDTPTSEVTATLESVTPLAKFTPNTLTPTVEMKGFISILLSDPVFFKSGTCEPRSVKFTVQVGNPAGTAFVVLFVRFKSRLTGATSEWTNFKMDFYNIGTFVHTLSADDMKGVGSFPNSWVQYQLVATDSQLHQIGRTAIFDERLALQDCVPSPTPAISPTPPATVP